MGLLTVMNNMFPTTGCKELIYDLNLISSNTLDYTLKCVRVAAGTITCNFIGSKSIK